MTVIKEARYMGEWTLITNHTIVLASIAKNPENTARKIGHSIGITERTVHKIIKELEKDGYITKNKVGIRNSYRIHPELTIKDVDSTVGELLKLIRPGK